MASCRLNEKSPCWEGVVEEGGCFVCLVFLLLFGFVCVWEGGGRIMAILLCIFLYSFLTVLVLFVCFVLCISVIVSQVFIASYMSKAKIWKAAHETILILNLWFENACYKGT